MCGRYAASRSPDDLVEEFEVERTDDAEAPTAVGAVPDWNVAPTKTAPVVLERTPREDRSAPPVRQLRELTWGLVPSWAKDRTAGARMINARAESLLDKGAFRRAATARRCLVPADGWYEWQASLVAQDTNGRPRKQPFYVHPVEARDAGIIAFAGIYEFWRDPGRDPDDPLAWLTTYAVITAPAEPGLDRIHERMPFVLPRDRWDRWLDPAVTDPDDVRALLEAPAPGRFAAVPVSSRVNDVRNNGPELVEPADAGSLLGVVDPATGEILGGQDAALF